jgi:hypothetical protein
LGDRGFHVGEVVVVTNQPTLISWVSERLDNRVSQPGASPET